MKMIKCDSCKEVTSVHGDDKRTMHRLRITTNVRSHYEMNIDMCSECFKKHNIEELLKTANENPEPIIESLRDMIREEIDNARDQ